MPALDPTSLAAAIADGLMEGAINAAARNADKLPALAEGLARGWVLGLQALTTKTTADSDTPPEAADIQKQIDAIKDAPTLP